MNKTFHISCRMLWLRNDDSLYWSPLLIPYGRTVLRRRIQLLSLAFLIWSAHSGLLSKQQSVAWLRKSCSGEQKCSATGDLSKRLCFQSSRWPLDVSEPKSQSTWNLAGSIRVTCRSKIAKVIPLKSKLDAVAAILKIYFRFSSWTKRSIDLKLGRKHWVTCRSKVAKTVSLEYPKMAAVATSLKIYFFASSPERNGQLTWNEIGSIRVTCRSKTAKLVPIETPR